MEIDPRFRPTVQFMEQGIPFNKHLGIRVEQLSPGRCVLRIPWQDRFIGDPLRPSVHGGVISTLVDTAGGAACFSQLGSHKARVATVDLRIDYLRPSARADLWCEARVLRMGNKVAVARMEVFAGAFPEPGSEEHEQALATGQGVYNVLRAESSTTIRAPD